MHIIKRNCLKQQKLNDLVFLKYNFQLKIKKKIGEKKDDT